MSEINHPIIKKNKILQSTVVALIAASIILITAVLPAEYGIDLIGAGKTLGFSKLYKPTEKSDSISWSDVLQGSHPLLKLENLGSGPEVKRPKEADNPPPKKQYEERQDTIKVIVKAGQGIEYKVGMLKYGELKYEWKTDNGTVFFDFHGDVKEVVISNRVYFESYTVAFSNNMMGTHLSPFEGRHGWFFNNESKSDIVITIRLKGQYIIIN